MKTYTCDICKKQFGHNVSLSVITSSRFNISDFSIDSGFNYTPREDVDICEECYSHIAKAQNDAIDKLKI